MLGFSVSIYRQDDYKKFNAPEVFDYRLASWTVGTRGLDWLDSLVKAGKATMKGNGYPFWYETKAEWVLPVISAGPVPYDGPVVIGEDYVMPKGWTGAMKVFQSNVDRCKPEDDLLVVACDQS